ncbi:methyltransferase domain-containing protein [Tricladium varicosporioides]|nr:methyltransferase domain-containing protein [Hymenoscyphus varicosporioides]
MPDQGASANDARVGTRDKSVAWYSSDLLLTDGARQLLEDYSKIPSGEVEEHILKIRDKAWDIFPYPCIGGFRFLDLAITTHACYPEILIRLKSQNQSLLDLGCCFGQELRALVAAGVPSSQLYGADLRPEFFDLGYELFRDRNTLETNFLAADVFDDSPGNRLNNIHGKMDIVYIGSFLHLFSWDDQIKAAIKINSLLKQKKGDLIVGRQMGARESRTREGERKAWRHDKESFERMWEEIGEQTGAKWKVEVRVEEIGMRENASEEEKRWREGNIIRLHFAILRE